MGNEKRAEVRKELADLLLNNIRKDPSDTRSIELLGKLKDYDLFARPEPAHHEQPIGDETCNRIMDIAERFFGRDVVIAPELAGKLMQIAQEHSALTPDEIREFKLAITKSESAPDHVQSGWAPKFAQPAVTSVSPVL